MGRGPERELEREEAHRRMPAGLFVSVRTGAVSWNEPSVEQVEPGGFEPPSRNVPKAASTRVVVP